MKKDKWTNIYLQYNSQKTRNQVTGTPMKTVGELMCSGRVSSSCSVSDTRRATLLTNPEISHECGEDWKVEHFRCHL